MAFFSEDLYIYAARSIKVEPLKIRLLQMQSTLSAGGIKGLIEKDTYWDGVLNQITAVHSALNSVGKLLLENHFKSCVIERIQEGDEEVISEWMMIMNKLLR